MTQIKKNNMTLQSTHYAPPHFSTGHTHLKFITDTREVDAGSPPQHTDEDTEARNLPAHSRVQTHTNRTPP